MIVGIAEVDAYPTRRLLRPALQCNPRSLKVVLPRLKLVRDDGERYVHWAGAVVRGNRASWGLDGLQGPALRE